MSAIPLRAIVSVDLPHAHTFMPNEEGQPQCIECFERGCPETGGAHEWETVPDGSGERGCFSQSCAACGKWKEE